MRCSKSDIKLFRSCFLFFLSLVNKYCLTHSVLVVSRLEKKKKKSIRECADYILWEMSPFLPQQVHLPPTCNCLGDYKLIN